jgi:dTDP-4-dehydrorhamnose reductase
VKILVLGASGQLAHHLRDELPQAAFWGRANLDLESSSADIRAAIVGFRPTVIVNAAAYTAVDKAETERSLAWAVNASAPAAIAQAATELGVPLLHVSTDYVFDGRKPSEYNVDDPVRPASVYGATKLAGELAVRGLCDKSWVLRTSWVFSEHGQNFVRTMLRLAATRESLRVVADQRGRPTYAGDLARAAAIIVGRFGGDAAVPFGVHHATGGPVVSWHEFAVEIVRRAHERRMLAAAVPIAPITTAEYPTAARRPANSALLPSSAVGADIGVSFDWRNGLDRALEKLATPSV